MKSPLKIGLNLLTIGLIGLGLSNFNKTEAINTLSDGWQVLNIENTDTLEGCMTITRGGTNYVFVATRSWEEWNSFKTVAAATGIGIYACGSGGGGGDLGDDGRTGI